MRRQKERRKNNIIKGVEFKKEESNIEISKFIEENLKTEVEVVKAQTIRRQGERNIIVAKLGNWEMKREIMAKKKNLKSGIYTAQQN